MKIHIIIIFFSVILGASCEKSESELWFYIIRKYSL